MRRFLNEASELPQNDDTPLQALAKLEQKNKSKKKDLSKKNEENAALTSLEQLDEIEENM